MNRRTATGLALLFSSATLVACDGTPELYAGQSLGTAPEQQDNTPKLKEYPSGPYGNHDSDIMGDISAPGYRTATLGWSAEGDDISLNKDFFNNSKLKCMLVSFGASWCGACQQEQGALPAEVAADPTFGVLNILIEGPQNGSNMVTREDVDAWVGQFHQNYPVILGEQGMKSLWGGYGSTIGLPFNLVVRTSDMTVMGEAIQGFSGTMKADAMARCEGTGG